MLTKEMQEVIKNFSAGSVATVNRDGTPSVSPKATFVVLDETTLAFSNLRSPGTVRNLRQNQAIEICFTDVLSRKAVRVTGTAEIVPKGKASDDLLAPFEAGWDYLVPHMSAFVVITVSAAEMILSPAYDRGAVEEDLRDANLALLNSL